MKKIIILLLCFTTYSVSAQMWACDFCCNIHGPKHTTKEGCCDIPSCDMSCSRIAERKRQEQERLKQQEAEQKEQRRLATEQRERQQKQREEQQEAEQKEKRRIATEQREREQQVQEMQRRIDTEKREREQKGQQEAEQTEGGQKDKTEKNTSSADTTTRRGYTSTYVESEKDRLARERQEASTTTILAVASGMGAIISANMNNTDEDDDLSIFLKYSLGFGYQRVPITDNIANKRSEPSTTNNMSVDMGLHFAIMNDKKINIHLTPFFTYGNLQFSNVMLTYGSGIKVGILPIKNNYSLRILLKGEYAKRQGLLYDYDAGTSSDYKYSTKKYGVGIYNGFGGHDSYIEVSVFREHISFLNEIKANIFSYDAKVGLRLFVMSVQYAPNYPIAGVIDYKSGYVKEKKGLLLLSLQVPLRIFSR